jgi:predicted DNA-binding transcriptional regulator AlpA
MSQIDQLAPSEFAANRVTRSRSTSGIVGVPYVGMIAGDKSGETIRRWVKLGWTPKPDRAGRNLSWPKFVIDEWAASGFPRLNLNDPS